MNLVINAWNWLAKPENQQTLGFIGGGLAILAVAGWQAYLHFSDKPRETPKPMISASNGGIAVVATGSVTNVVGDNNTVGITSADVKEIVTTLTKIHHLDTQAKDEQIKALTEAVTALSKGQGIVANQSELNAAFAALTQGNTTLAKSLFAKTAEIAEQQAKQGAEALRNLGALAFLDNTEEALQAYRRATQLDPDNANGWNQLGHLLKRVGDLIEAIAAYNTVLALGEKHVDQEEIAAAYGNLGIVYYIHGDLDKAIELYQKALKLAEDLGNKEGMANQYINVGNVYQTRGDLDKAIEFHQKAFKLYEDLGSKEGMAMVYGNLGNVSQLQGNKTEAKRYYLMSKELFKQLGSPNAKTAQTRLDALL